MGWLDRTLHKLKLITVPPTDDAVTVVWDFVKDEDVIMPARCSGDPAHGTGTTQRKIPGKRSKSGESKVSGKGCLFGALANLILLPLGFFWIPGIWSRETLKLTFNRTAPYCDACYRGARRTSTATVLLVVVLLLGSCTACGAFSFITEEETATVGLAVLLPSSLLALASLIAIFALGKARKQAHTIRIVDFDPVTGGTKVTLQFRSRTYADLFLLDNSVAALHDPRAAVRERAASELGRLRNPMTIENLVGALGDKERSVRKAAADALVRWRDPAAVEPLVRSLGEGDETTRLAVVDVLGEMGGEQAIEALIGAMTRDTSPQVRLAAAQALAAACHTSAGPTGTRAQAWVGSQRMTEALADALAQGEPARVRFVCAEALALAGEVAVPPLIAALQDPDPSVRARAAQSLGQLRDQRATPALIASLADTSEGVRQAAAGALGQLGDALAFDPLVLVLQDPSPQVRQRAGEALLALAPTEPLAQQLHSLIHSGAEGRAQAATALGELQDPRAIPALGRALYDFVEVRQRATQALVGFGPALALATLRTALIAEDANVRAAAAEAMGILGDSAVQEALLAALQDPSVAVRQNAASALTTACDPSFAPRAQMIRSLVTGEATERERAAAQLGEIRERRAEPPLTWALTYDPEATVRLAAAHALERLGAAPAELLAQALGTGDDALAVAVLVELGADAVPPLIAVVETDDGAAQRAAISALGQIGDPRAIPALIAATESVKGRMRELATRALGSMVGDPRVVPHLISLLQDSNPDVQGAAVVVLGQSGDPRAAAPLVQVLDKPLLREPVGQALTALGDLATEALLARLEGERDRHMRRTINQLLGDRKPPSLRDRLFGR
ncbi:MAG: HEAT repeat domain-containing protein [Anaerolineae bacterium]|nr:HEAT repeat domain-containing protein [Anaerolineae bacterium]